MKQYEQYLKCSSTRSAKKEQSERWFHTPRAIKEYKYYNLIIRFKSEKQQKPR
ncbi:unnamed protein product [Paramecium octaurelia]|uniref:Uncharacterized protein n=1 Tax=Paramecium octaurelia TaxID=43137 RepID=A0A8S1YBM2_PAROT|nr:unnamed protein product [Paramecium octaurelia]